ncbi:MAG: LysE family translocator [Enterobacterales bacterium]|nr:LysE family translocator [Enterobacterales bacterium]
MEYSTLLLFIPTILLVSSTPGLCMTLAFSLGLRYGYQKTLWMMIGELAGVFLVVTTSLLGVAQLMLKHPDWFSVLKVAGACYLFYVALQLWRSASRFEQQSCHTVVKGKDLIIQGFVTAVSNPKGWAFSVSLFPGFLNQSNPLPIQIATMVGIFLVSEFLFMSIYALGGNTLRRFLSADDHLQRLNQAVAVLIAGIAIWLLLSF